MTMMVRMMMMMMMMTTRWGMFTILCRKSCRLFVALATTTNAALFIFASFTVDDVDDDDDNDDDDDHDDDHDDHDDHQNGPKIQIFKDVPDHF